MGRRYSKGPTGRSLFRYAAATVFVIGFSGTALPVRADETAGMTRLCRVLYKEWRKAAMHKAFAASQVLDGQQACGYSYAWGSQKKAINSALGHCKSAASYRNLKTAVCRLVKVQ